MGLTHNFNPHITLIYNSGKDKDREVTKTSKGIQEIIPNRTVFKASTLAIGELGPAGNVINITYRLKIGGYYQLAEKVSPRLTPI